MRQVLSLLLIGVATLALPFGYAVSQETASPNVTTPQSDSKPVVPSAPVPLSPGSPPVNTSVPQQATVLVPLPGTGSTSPTGVQKESAPIHPGHPSPSPESLTSGKLVPGLVAGGKEIVDLLKPAPHPVDIAHLVSVETSARLSRVLLLLEVLLWLALVAVLVASVVIAGRVVALVGSGLQSAAQAALLRSQATVAARLSTPINPLPPVNPVGPSSMPTVGT
jgi:hypothetical protein